MTITIIDAVIIGLILVGAIGGVAKGGFTTLLSFVGVIVISYLSWVLRTPIAEQLMRFAPFFKFGGDFEGVTSLNILLYEVIAFFLVAGVLSLILGIVLKVTGWIEKILKSTIILGLPSRLIGAFAGALEAYVLIFVIICVLNNPFVNIKIGNSSVARWMMEKTPIISNLVDGTISSSTDIYTLVNGRKNYTTEQLDFETLKILLEHEVVDPGSAYELVRKGKIKVPGAEELIKNYE